MKNEEQKMIQALRRAEKWDDLPCLGMKFDKDSDSDDNDVENNNNVLPKQDQKELLYDLTMAMDIIKEKHPLYEKPMSEVLPLFGRLNWDKFDDIHDEITDKHKE